MKNRSRVSATVMVPAILVDHPEDPSWAKVAGEVLAAMNRTASERSRRVFGRPELMESEAEDEIVRLTFIADTEPLPRSA